MGGVGRPGVGVSAVEGLVDGWGLEGGGGEGEGEGEGGQYRFVVVPVGAHGGWSEGCCGGMVEMVSGR